MKDRDIPSTDGSTFSDPGRDAGTSAGASFAAQFVCSREETTIASGHEAVRTPPGGEMPPTSPDSEALMHARYTAAIAMYAALSNLPCRCRHNVPYEECKVKRVVTQECRRCSSMKTWEALQ